MKINNKIEDDINYLKLLDILEEKKKTKGECNIKLNNNHEINFSITLSSKEIPSNSKNNSFMDKIKIFSSTKNPSNNTSNNNNINKIEINKNIINEKERKKTIAINPHKEKLNLFNNNKEEPKKFPNPIKKNNGNKINEATKAEQKSKTEVNKEKALTIPKKNQSKDDDLRNRKENNEIPKKENSNYSKEELNLNLQVNKENISEKKEENVKIDNNSLVKKESPNEVKTEKVEQLKSMPLETNQKEVLNISNKIAHESQSLSNISNISNTYKINTTNFNIIYLIDTTLSMKKYENFIYFLPNINSFLEKIFIKLKIGYVLYKDFLVYNEDYYFNKIKIYLPSKSNINLPADLEFSGGFDYSEDWAYSIYKISEETKENEENIVIHICDSNAHGSRFSDYDNKDEMEKVLIEALKKCKNKNIKFIGLLIDILASKSFFECKKIYNELDGFYDIIDLTKNLDFHFLLNKITEKISNIVKIEYIRVEKHWSSFFFEVDESNFKFNKLIVEMSPLYETRQYKSEKFTFLPKIQIETFNSYLKSDKMYGIRQGYIGDCYLISSIISMLNYPLIFNYIFPNSSNINEKTQYIDMLIYENGIKKLISFKNTYAINNGNLLFVKPYKNELYAMAIEKGFSVSKCTDGTIKSGYKNIEGGSGYIVFDTILGAESERYISNNNLIHLIFKNGYKYINKGNLQAKIKKYIDFGGIITFGVYYNLGRAHEYSLQGYKSDDNGNLLVEIINPHRSGRYAEENIFLNKDNNKKKLLKNGNKYPIIYEDDFTNNECKESLYSYKSTGYMIMEFETFYRWYGTIDMCDPMIGYYEQMIEFIPNGNNIHSFDLKINLKTKFKAYIFIKENSLNIKNYNFIIKYRNGNIIFNDEFDYNNKIFYEILEKGFYLIEIKSKKEEEIKDVIYLKIFCKETIKKEHNDIIFYGFFCPDIYIEMVFIHEFIIKFYNFINNNNIYFFEIPNEKSIYFCCPNNPNNILKNFYIYYINTMNGFFVEVIFKYKWIFFLIMEYRYNCSYYIIYTKYGNFKCSRKFEFFDFDILFKINVLNDILYSKVLLWSEKIHHKKTYDIIKDLEESKINFINISGQSCYQSAYLQGFIHIVIPIAIKYLINKRKNKNLANFINLDQLKNNNEFNNAIIDIMKEVVDRKNNEVNQNENKNILAKKIHYLERDNLKGFLGCNHEGPGCQKLINEAIKNFALNALDDKIQNQNPLNLSKKPDVNNSNENKEYYIDAIEISKSTIVSEIMKIKIENKNFLNIVLQLDENSENVKNLDIIKLINNCKQIKTTNNEKRKINELSDILYIIIDRIKIDFTKKAFIYLQNFGIYEKIYYNNILGIISEIESIDSISYELKFIIVHEIYSANSGHYTAYVKIKGEWYHFNDLELNCLRKIPDRDRKRIMILR